MKSFKSHFKFNKQERSGIFFLLAIIVLFQLIYLGIRFFPPRESGTVILLDGEAQEQIDRLKQRAQRKDSTTLYPFNPNFITDFKGYTLGMSVAEIDRLHAYRKLDKFVNSKEEFQNVTQISDSLLEAISPHFKFPEWAVSGKRPAIEGKPYAVNSKDPPVPNGEQKELLDLNLATIEDLRTINGIGEKLSERIIRFRDRLGGFLVDDQLYDVYGLEPEVVLRTLKRFRVLNAPEIEKININTATADEIAQLVYFQKYVAERIVDYRNNNGTIVSFNELSKVQDFPSDKIDRIKLYLSL